MRRIPWSACVAIAVLLASGCDWSDDEAPESPLNEEQAGERAEKHISDTVAALPDSLELAPLGRTVSAACDPEPLITVSKRYWLDGLPAEENDEHVEALGEYWNTNGDTVVEDLRPDKLFVSVRNDEDKFQMSVRSGVQGDLSISTSSPCIHPSGTDESE